MLRRCYTTEPPTSAAPKLILKATVVHSGSRTWQELQALVAVSLKMSQGSPKWN
jgi:hypothetical protein